MTAATSEPSRQDLCGVRVLHRERIDLASREVIGDRHIDRLSGIFKTLGDPTRLKILLALRTGEMCVCDLAAFVKISESATSHQLRRLRETGLVCNRREGQVLYYTLDDDHVLDLLNTALLHLHEDHPEDLGQ